MRNAAVVICLSLGLATAPFSLAGKKGGGGGGGGGKGGHASGGGGHARGGGGGGRGGGSGARAAHNMGGGSGNHQMRGGGGQHAHNNLSGGHGGGAHQGARHGLNSHNRTAGGSLNGRHQGAARHNGHQGNFAHHQGNNFSHGGRNAHFRNGRGGNWRASHWRNSHEVFRGYHRVWHDHGWWGSHYDVVVVGGGWGPWYWDGGYWYPAWGYAPGFVYGCDCPIYSYANLPPDQVVVNIQEALQDQGYYSGEIDGQLGQLTRDALGQYQQDHLLEVTAAIDEPTVQSLGLMTAQS